jgi:hypothetical protein
MLSFTDDELLAVRDLARPFSPADRARFLADVAQALANCPSRGPSMAHSSG